MNYEEFLLKQAEQQSQLIDRLLKENASLRDIINVCLLPGKELSDTEKELISLMVGNSGSYSFHPGEKNGNNGISSFRDDKDGGNSGNSSFHSEWNNGNMRIDTFHNAMNNGNSGIDGFYDRRMDGNSGNPPGSTDVIPIMDETRLAGVMSRLTPMMKKAPRKTKQYTAVLLFHWRANPAAAPAALRKFTGLSPDGMAKRVMAMKKAGLIVRYSHPLRYILTEKAQELLKGQSAKS